MQIDKLFDEYVAYALNRDKITTISHKIGIYNKYIRNYFDNCDINDIDTTKYISWENYVKSLVNNNNTLSNIYTCIKTFYDYLNLMYDIQNIPYKLGKMNINSVQKKHEYKTFNTREFKKFISSVDDKMYHALFNTLFYTGMRKGELLALKVDDIHFNCLSNYIIVDKTITKEVFDGKRLIQKPKSQSSIRKVYIDILLANELKSLIKYYKQNYEDFNSKFYLFGANKPIACTTLERKKNFYCDKAKVKRIRIHDFRHSHATMLYNHHVNIKLIQSRLGHSSPSTTLNTYVHEDKKQEKRLINKISLIHLI